MNKQVGAFIFLLFLFSACGAPAITEPGIEAPNTPTLITTLLPTLILQPQSPPQTPFCQAEPEYIQLGSSTKIAVFALPPSQSLAVYLDSKFIATGLTNLDGYASIDVLIPADETIGLHQISIYATGTLISVTCQIRFWSDLIPSPTFSPASTLTPAPSLSSYQLTRTATQQSLKDKLGANCYYGSAQGIRLSPNGQWAEATCDPYSIIIGRIDGTKEWSLSSDSLIGPYTEHFVHVSHWSNDSAYAYINVDPHTDGYWEPFHQGMVLFRLSLESGEISEVLPQGKSDWIFYSFAFSPNDRKLAYIMTDQSPVKMNMRDMQTGLEHSYEFDPKYNTGGGFVWSPDSQKLVFSVTQFDASTYQYLASSIILWEKDEAKLTELIKDHQSRMQALEWKDQMKFTLQAEILGPEKVTTQKYEFDLTNNELTELNP